MTNLPSEMKPQRADADHGATVESGPGGKPPAPPPPRTGGSRWRKLAGIVIPPLTALSALIAAWQVLVRTLDVPSYILPAPSEIVVRLGETWADRMVPNLLVTAREIVLGFLLAAILGVLVGLIVASNRLVERTVYPILVFLQLIPKIAVAPLFVVWFGFGLSPKVLIVFLIAFFPTLVSSMSGFKDLNPRLTYLTRSMGASAWQTFRYVRLPSALPFVFSGLRVSIVLATLAAIVAEFVGANAGLGYLILQASSVLDLSLVFATLLTLSALGLAFSFLISGLERLAMPWKEGRSDV